MSVTDVIKNLVFGGWNGPPRPKVLGIADVARTADKKLQFLEKDIPLPQELQLDNTRPVFDLLCEDAVMFYTVRQLWACPSIHDSCTHPTACSRTQHNPICTLVHFLKSLCTSESTQSH